MTDEKLLQKRNGKETKWKKNNIYTSIYVYISIFAVITLN